MSINRAAKFQRLFQEHEEPKLQISIYNRLLDIMDKKSAFDMLCKYERGLIDIKDMNCMLMPGLQHQSEKGEHSCHIVKTAVNL